MRTVAVVMLHVDLEHLLQVATPDDQQPIQALSSDRSNPPLGVGVRVGRLHRRQEHLDTLRAEHIVECAAELRVAVVDKEAQPSPSFSEHQQEVSGLLGDPGTVRVGAHAGQVDPSGVQFDEEQHVQSAQSDGIDGEEVAGDDAGGLLAQERPPRDGVRPRRGVQPVAPQRSTDRGG